MGTIGNQKTIIQNVTLFFSALYYFIIPAKAREYVFTGVGLCVCVYLCVCLYHDN